MTNSIIKIENVSKLYRLGTVGTQSIQGDLKRWWASLRGKDDPFSLVGIENNLSSQNDGEYVWALKDINLDIKQGDVVGIIGKNGAGKSTLLKILSRVTTPTTGNIKIHGRIASLLEVGTGFHPELTGRENIFLNGSILGMTKSEIISKFDEIVAFSGVEKYIDTPVKRYSSGMYVRLAFAVAAHLEPEILIIDEVLAVGDAEFQRKALGKMQDISNSQGRTVLFVSHNLDAVKKLCKSAILLQNGSVTNVGNTHEIVDLYNDDLYQISNNQINFKAIQNEFVSINSIIIKDINGTNITNPKISEQFSIELTIEFKKKLSDVKFHFDFRTFDGNLIFSFIPQTLFNSNNNSIAISIQVPSHLFNNNRYFLSIGMTDFSTISDDKIYFYEREAYSFTIIDDFDDLISRSLYKKKYEGVFRPILQFNYRYE